MAVLRSILRLTPLPARADELISLFTEQDVFGRAGTTSGYQGGEVQIAVDGEEVVVTATWASAAAYDSWLQSTERDRINALLLPLLATRPDGRLYEIVVNHEAGQ